MVRWQAFALTGTVVRLLWKVDRLRVRGAQSATQVTIIGTVYGWKGAASWRWHMESGSALNAWCTVDNPDIQVLRHC